jgi:SAM-dependent methyltransferase
MSSPAAETIHLLPVSLLDEHRDLVYEFRHLSRKVGVQPGWHYLLDLAWAANLLRDLDLRANLVLDAGAGVGLMQWWLAQRGVDVISVDRVDRHFGRRMRATAEVVGLSEPLPSLRVAATRQLASNTTGNLTQRIGRSARAVRDLVAREPSPTAEGTIRVLTADLASLRDVADASVDAVVSISSLEHNPPDLLPAIIAELMRVIRPDGLLIATVGASDAADWYHEPSRGWCYSEASVRSIFQFGDSVPSNYEEYRQILAGIRESAELRDNLAGFYFRSGDNGMPWGKWDPQYLSVGVVKHRGDAAASARA